MSVMCSVKVLKQWPNKRTNLCLIFERANDYNQEQNGFLFTKKYFAKLDLIFSGANCFCFFVFIQFFDKLSRLCNLQLAKPEKFE